MLRKWSYLTAAFMLLVAAGCGGSDQPGGPQQQAAAIDTLGTSYIQPQHQGFLLIRPKQIIESQVVQSLLQMAPEDDDIVGDIRNNLGIDPRIIESIVLIGGGKPEALRDVAGKVVQGGVPEGEQKDISGCMVIHASESLQEILQDHPGLEDHTEAKHGTATYLKAPDDTKPSLYFIDPQTVLLAADFEIGSYIDHPPAAGPLYALVAKTDLNHDIVGVGVTGELAALAENPPNALNLPAQAKAILKLLADVRHGNLVIDVGGAPAFHCSMNFGQETNADKFTKQADAWFQLLKTMAQFSLPDMDFPPQVDKTAAVELILETVNSLTVKRQDLVVTLSGGTPQDFVPRLEDILRGVVEAQRQAALKARPQQHLQNLALAVHQYHADHGRLPADIVAADGTPLLSWRVELLPYLNAREQYEQLHRDEPWNSEHNAKVLAQMPKAFALSVDETGGMTDALAPSGPGTWIDSKTPVTLANITDGAATTILLVQVQPEYAVPWAKPGDYTFDANNPAAVLGASAADENVNVAFVSAYIDTLPKSLKPEQWLALFSRAGGEVIDFLTDEKAAFRELRSLPPVTPESTLPAPAPPLAPN